MPKGRVKYWLTFNEINSILHSPLMSGGIMTPMDKLTQQDLYQAIHHELVASAKAVKLAHEMMPGAMVKVDEFTAVPRTMCLPP